MLRLQTVAVRHADVHQHQVRLQLACLLDRLQPVRRLSHDLKVGLKVEQLGQPLGRPHLSSQDLAEIIQIPSSFEPLGLDATLARAFLL